MPNPFVWYELMTTDPQAALAFYSAIVGWNGETVPMPGMDYTLLKVGDRQVAGLMARPQNADSMPPSWFAYVGVDDVDAMAGRVEAAGGKVHRAPGDIPGIGRFAVVADPQGAGFMLFKGAGEALEPLPTMTPGTVGWHELHAKDVEAATAFYHGLFGWETEKDLEMGPMGIYRLIRADSPYADAAIFAGDHAPGWLLYFAVPDIDAAAAAITAHGGTLLRPMMEVPGGAWVTTARDPQGAVFSVVGMKKS